MYEPDSKKNPDTQELDEAQVEEVGGGGDLCSGPELERLTESLKQSYENLVDFTSHVIERVAGSN
jgi:hypothetical protein